MDGLRRARSEIVGDGGDVQPRDVHLFQLNLEPLWIPQCGCGVSLRLGDGAKRVKSKCTPHSVQCEIHVAILNHSRSLTFVAVQQALPPLCLMALGTSEALSLAQRHSRIAPASCRATFRFSVNLIGGRAMNVAEFRKWQPIRSDETHKLRDASLGLQARTLLLTALGTLDSGRLRRSLVLYNEP